MVIPVLAAVQAAIAAAPATQAGAAEELEEIVVYGIHYRNRVEDAAPVLSYDLEYFQRFEPATVGDMLKRVPGVAFVGSDVMEYDSVQMRGLSGGYTQVLINGRKVPGAGDDRSFWVDRIPAELVERVEFLRSNSANRSGDAVAGTVNIVLRDAYTFEGTYVRAGMNRWFDGEVNPTAGLVASGDVGGGRILAGINMQDRYRSKIKRSDRFEDDSLDAKVSWEDQTEVKDGRDYSANLSYTVDFGDTGRLAIDGFFVKTDRDVVEDSFEEEADDGDTINLFVPGLNPLAQRNFGLSAEYRLSAGGGTTGLLVDHARFQDDSYESEAEHSYIGGTFDDTWSLDGATWEESEAERSDIDADDAETGFRLSHQRPIGAVEAEFGVDSRHKRRDTTYTNFEWESDVEVDLNTFRLATVPFELDGVTSTKITEKRLDPYMQVKGKAGRLSWEAGLRYETTDSDVDLVDLDDEGEVNAAGSASTDHEELLPSLHFRWSLGDADRINMSFAGSVKRPNFNELVPVLLDGEFGDNDYIGNPTLKLESARGFDVGYEHRLGNRGVVGINVFYRRIKDLVELANTGLASIAYLEDVSDDVFGDEDYGADFMEDYLDANPGSSRLQAQAALQADVEGAGGQWDPDSWLFTSSNVGGGKVYGFEVDLSAPLTGLGLPNTGVFLNYSYVESEVGDFFGERRFNDQAKSVYNVGFIHSLPALGASFGATFRRQGDARARLLGEEVLVHYGQELDVFVEKSFGRNISVRLSANNLLDASKDEFFGKFDNQGDQTLRAYDEYELETEQAGPSYQLVMRWAF